MQLYDHQPQSRGDKNCIEAFCAGGALQKSGSVERETFTATHPEHPDLKQISKPQPDTSKWSSRLMHRREQRFSIRAFTEFFRRLISCPRI